MSHHEDKKEKKRKKNIHDLLLFAGVKKMLENVDIGTPDTRRKPDAEGRAFKPALHTEHGEEVAEKLATVHKSLALRKREAQDRWNRFSGTSGGGGRGR